MNDKAKGFDLRLEPIRDARAGQERLAGEAERLSRMLADATPPSAMRAAPVAPARGTMRLVDNWEVQAGGTRRLDGSRWLAPSSLDIENSFARKRGGAVAVERAEERAERRGQALTGEDEEAALRRVDLFTPGQVAMADRYRALVEWRAGSAIKCASLEAGRGGASGRDYIDSFIDAGEELDWLVAAIGAEVCLSPRRHMDRDNARGPLTVRQAVDGVILSGLTISALLKRHGWAAKGQTRKTVKDAIRGALDRMQGYGSRRGAK